MDNYCLARVAVEESPDFANVSDMVAGRLRARVYVGDHGHMCATDGTQVPDEQRSRQIRNAHIRMDFLNKLVWLIIPLVLKYTNQQQVYMILIILNTHVT